MKILIVIPAYNEEESIGKVVENLKTNYAQYDYVVVNDGSTDGTEKLCREKGYNLISLPVNLGLAGAVQTGMLYAWNHGYDAAIQFDADGQHRAEYIGEMAAKLEDGYDVVIGSRFVSRKKPHSLRMLGGNLIAGTIKLVTGKKLRDPTSGMRMYNRSVIEYLAKQINFAPEPDTIGYLIYCGAKVAEIQVTMDERTAGTSYLNLFRSIGYMLQVEISILFMRLFRKREKVFHDSCEEGR